MTLTIMGLFSNLPLWSKLFKYEVAWQLQEFLDDNNLDKFQSGFRPGLEMEMVILVVSLRRELNSGNMPLLALLDVLVVLNTIHHGIFLEQLAEIVLKGLVLCRFYSFLPNRNQKVVLQNICSSP